MNFVFNFNSTVNLKLNLSIFQILFQLNINLSLTLSQFFYFKFTFKHICFVSHFENLKRLLHSTLPTMIHGPLRPVTLSVQSPALLHWVFVYFEREIQCLRSHFSLNKILSTDQLFFHQFSFVCLVLKRYLKISRSHEVARACETKILQKKYSFEVERKGTTFHCNKRNNRRRVRAFTKKEMESFSDVISITDWRSTL